MNKKNLSETDIITKYILPAVEAAGWDKMSQVRQEVKLRDGKVIVRGQVGMRKTVKAAQKTQQQFTDAVVAGALTNNADTSRV